MRFSANPPAIRKMLRFAGCAADNCYTDCIVHDEPLHAAMRNRFLTNARLRFFGLGLLGLSFAGCQWDYGDHHNAWDPRNAGQYKYAKQSAAVMEMQERGARGVPGSVPSMESFPLASEQAPATVSDQ